MERDLPLSHDSRTTPSCSRGSPGEPQPRLLRGRSTRMPTRSMEPPKLGHHVLLGFRLFRVLAAHVHPRGCERLRPTGVRLLRRLRARTIEMSRPSGRTEDRRRGCKRRRASATNTVYWNCSDDSTGRRHRAVQLRPVAGYQGAAHVIFPSCWDGVHKDSANHKSHMPTDYAAGARPAPGPIAGSPEPSLAVTNGTGGKLSADRPTRSTATSSTLGPESLEDIGPGLHHTGTACGHLHEDGARTEPGARPAAPVLAARG